MLTNWLEQHGFICIKDYNTSLVYQKINKDDILESEENIYDSISLNNHK